MFKSVQSGLPYGILGELSGGVTGALQVPPLMICKGGKPAFLEEGAPLIPPVAVDATVTQEEDKPLSQGIKDKPSPAPPPGGPYDEDAGLTVDDTQQSPC